MGVQISGKWVTVAPADAPTGVVAAQILAARLHGVLHALPLAAHEASEDIEHVHQLRVGCRRADAAVRAFAAVLGKRKKPLRRRLKRIRQAAGAARDFDVFIEQFQSEREQLSDEGLRLLELLERRRDAAQPPLVKVEANARRDGFVVEIAKAINAAELRADSKVGRRPFRKFAADALTGAADRFLQKMDVARLENIAASIDQLHKLRIVGKRLRYTLELFHSAFEPSVRDELYPQIEELQDRLGAVNDHASAQRLLQKLLARLPADGFAADIAGRVICQHSRGEQCQEEFEAWWTADRRERVRSGLAEFS